MVIVGSATEPLGIIGVADKVRESARDAVQLLREQGVRHVALLTGDHEPAARTLAGQLDIDDVRAHGRDERVGVKQYFEGLEFQYALIRMLAK